ncbi:RNA-directed DNA polymerase, eukaryota, reverse transcriptase zinc-binding domain protein [Tanacetum coccineum]
MRKSANKYAVLSEERNDEEFERDVCQDDRVVVDRFILMKSKPPPEEMLKWTYDMKLYFKYRWDAVNRGDESSDEEDIIEEFNAAKDLFGTSEKNLVKNDPWVIMGDFNVTMNAAEHSSGCSGKNANMVEFSDAINNLKIEYICSSGFHYTWTKSLKNPQCKTLKKLDRILINDEFLQRFQDAHGVFLPYMVSDHSPVVLHIKNGFQRKKSSFRFCNFVADKAEFIDLVKDAWSKDFSWVSHVLKDSLKSLQAEIDIKPHDERIRKEDIKVLNEYVEASKVEMKLLHQKAKIKWLNEGGQKHCLFYGILKSRRNKSRVEFIKDDDGISYEGQDVNKQFVKHFEQFLGKVDNVSSVDESIFKSTLGSEEAYNMTCEVSDEEIKEAMFDIDSNKAPGPDGFTSEFFKKAWDIVGDEVCLAIKEFFRNGKLRGEENGPKRCAMEIDIQKAYDTVSCSFLEDILGKFRFHRRMVDWIMTCVKSTTFTICLNGELNGFFKGVRGLRQGDPISPYLFTLVMEVFYLIMEKNIEESKVFGYHFGCKELKLSYMFFADDLLVLFKGNRESIKIVKKSLEEFSDVSGLVPNLGKSIIFFGSISERDKLDLLQVMPFKCGKFPVRYLGVPLLAKKLGVGDCKVLIDKVEDRINNWRNNALSYTGRIQLIASVLASMQMYWASVYLLPTTVINDLEKLFKRFLWNAGDSAKGKARVSWKVVCKPKDQGGLGIKSLKQWNEVLMIRQFWKIIEDKNSLWAKWVNRVKLRNKSIWEVKVDKCDSWGWKTMLFIRDKIRNHVWYDIGDGRKASLWYDRWCNEGPLNTVISRREIYYARLDDNAKVADMINNNQWVWPDGWTEKYTILSNLDGDVNLSSKEDKVLWVTNAGKKVVFITKQAWEDLRVNWPSNRLLTQDKVEKWNHNSDIKCGFCKQCSDSSPHLFFQCDFSMKIWRKMIKLSYLMDMQFNLQDVIESMACRRGMKSIGNMVNKLIMAAIVYFIWQERNFGLFKGECRSEDVLHAEAPILSNSPILILLINGGGILFSQLSDALAVGDKSQGNVAKWDCVPE